MLIFLTVSKIEKIIVNNTQYENFIAQWLLIYNFCSKKLTNSIIKCNRLQLEGLVEASRLFVLEVF